MSFILQNADAHRLAVAPMMERTDRHCRAFHRLLAPRAMLYTEMLTADAVVHGDTARLLHCHDDTSTVLQLGGSDPARLADAVRRANDFAYAEYNLNIGCPSDRVQAGRFGACLMAEPRLVARCCAAMIAAAGGRPVSVKCRIGIDESPPAALDDFIAAVADSGVGHFILHARKAWLGGLSPKENREIPPLEYDRVRHLRDTFPRLAFSINGGIATAADAAAWADEFAGVMIGRAAYHTPYMLAESSAAIYGHGPACRFAVAKAMAEYAREAMAGEEGLRLIAITRHMLGLMTGLPGARGWRRALSEQARDRNATAGLILAAAESVAAKTTARNLAA